MALDRTPFNAMIDDDGSNLVGTVWGKDDIKDVILDPVDQAIGDCCEGRLTLTSGVPVTTADVVGASTLYFTPYKGRRLSLYSGSAWLTLTFTERSIALAGLFANTPYDVFAYIAAGAVSLEVLTWGASNARNTALVVQDGVLVKSGAPTRRYLGTFRTTSATTTEDSAAKRFLWNYYNRQRRVLSRLEPADSWLYDATVWRQANANAANQVEVVIGVAEVVIDLLLASTAIAVTTSGGFFRIGIGEDSTTGPAPGSLPASIHLGVLNCFTYAAALLRKSPTIGYHAYTWIEYGTPIGGGATFFGDGGAPLHFQTGMVGLIDG